MWRPMIARMLPPVPKGTCVHEEAVAAAAAFSSAMRIGCEETDACKLWALQNMWTDSYDGCACPPSSAPDEVVYLTLVDGDACASGHGEALGRGGSVAAYRTWLEPALTLAKEHGGLFRITASNPAGKERPHVENVVKHELPATDVQELCPATRGSSTRWRAFAFAAARQTSSGRGLPTVGGGSSLRATVWPESAPRAHAGPRSAVVLRAPRSRPVFETSRRLQAPPAG